jgi:hypothetical protein
MCMYPNDPSCEQQICTDCGKLCMALFYECDALKEAGVIEMLHQYKLDYSFRCSSTKQILTIYMTATNCD